MIVIVKLFSAGPFFPMTNDQLVFNFITQGVLSGFVAVMLYAMAIDRLGEARAASFSVLMLMLAAFIAWLWLVEVPLWTDIVALCFGVLGMGVINGIIRLPKRRQIPK